jgi:hypothetical protein
MCIVFGGAEKSVKRDPKALFSKVGIFRYLEKYIFNINILHENWRCGPGLFRGATSAGKANRHPFFDVI